MARAKRRAVADVMWMMLLMEMMGLSGLFRFGIGADALGMDYYFMTCPFAEQIVMNTVTSALQSDPTLAAGLLRMHFHDCFIRVLHYNPSVTACMHIHIDKRCELKAQLYTKQVHHMDPYLYTAFLCCLLNLNMEYMCVCRDVTGQCC